MTGERLRKGSLWCCAQLGSARPQQLGRLGDVGGNAPGFVAGGAAWPPRVRLSTPPAIACAHRRSASLEGTINLSAGRGNDEAARVHRAYGRECRMAVRCARAAVGDAGNRVSQSRITRVGCRAADRRPTRPEGGLAIWTGWTSWRAMITRVPRLVRCQSRIAKSFAKRMQPCEAGWPGKTPACRAIPDQVIRCI
jgi:hypothetical protein